MALPEAGDSFRDTEACGSEGTWMAPDAAGDTILHVETDALLEREPMTMVSVTLLGSPDEGAVFSVTDGTLVGASWWWGDGGTSHDVADLGDGTVTFGTQGSDDSAGNPRWAVVWDLTFGDPSGALAWTRAQGDDDVLLGVR
jgi:hypothetical protein